MKVYTAFNSALSEYFGSFFLTLANSDRSMLFQKSFEMFKLLSFVHIFRHLMHYNGKKRYIQRTIYRVKLALFRHPLYQWYLKETRDS